MLYKKIIYGCKVIVIKYVFIKYGQMKEKMFKIKNKLSI